LIQGNPLSPQRFIGWLLLVVVLLAVRLVVVVVPAV
jgi:hypothetical protein